MAKQRYKHVRAIERGLAVLTAMNQFDGASAPDLAAATGIHRTTIYRILETLEELGYVRSDPSRQTFYLTLKMRSLTSGLHHDMWVSEIAAPVLGALFEEVLWPTSLATFDQDAMLIRETTHRFSPFSMHHAVVGTRLPLLTTALGRAYISFCGEDERRIIVENLRALPANGSQMLCKSAIDQMVQTARKKGYTSSMGDADPRFASFALPIRWDGRVIAALNLVFFRSAMTMTAAVERYLPSLKRAAALMEAGLLACEKDFSGEFSLNAPQRPSATSPPNLPLVRSRSLIGLPRIKEKG